MHPLLCLERDSAASSTDCIGSAAKQQQQFFFTPNVSTRATPTLFGNAYWTEAERSHHGRATDLHRLPRQLPQRPDSGGQLGRAGAGEGGKTAWSERGRKRRQQRRRRERGRGRARVHGGRYMDVSVPDVLFAQLSLPVVQHQVGGGVTSIATPGRVGLNC